MIKKLTFLFKILLIYFFIINCGFANIQKDLIEKFLSTKTLSFNFVQKIEEKEEKGNCFIKYPLLMKCNYKNSKEKILISNGKTLAIIKKKYKKIYYYPLNSAPLSIILDKNKILNLIKKNKPTKIDRNVIKFEFIDKKKIKSKFFLTEIV